MSRTLARIHICDMDNSYEWVSHYHHICMTRQGVSKYEWVMSRTWARIHICDMNDSYEWVSH